ncbi:folate-binding protein [Deltaproteobacteria bacterium]|nr:folate-binding protein [Deltaproteobacteria bacterium]
MSIEQQAFLNAIGASLGDDGHSHFDDGDASQSLPDNFITPIPYYGLLAISGPETSKFLQGQTTCDLEMVSNTQSCAGAYCTPKGRMISSFHIGRLDPEHYLLRMQHDIVDTTRDTLAKYIVFSKAEQENASDLHQVFGLCGEQALKAVEHTFGQVPSGKWSTVNTDQQLVIQLDDEGLVFECWIPNQLAELTWQSLCEQLKPVGSQQWGLLSIQRGEAEVCATTVDTFIPQVLNYQVTGAVSFTKGCYTGQEVVARMEYRGKLKRRMYRAQLASTGIQPGDAIYTGDKEQSSGNVVNVASLDSNSSEILAVLTNKDVAENLLFHLENNPAALELLPLPYTIESD